MEKSIKIEGSKNVVTGTGNRVVQKITEIYHALGKKQFIALVGGLLVLLFAGIIGIRALDLGQKLIYASVDEVESELNALFQNDEALRTQLGDKQEMILKAISDGVRLLKDKDYTKAIEKFKSIPQEVRLAGIYNNIGYAYAQLGNKDQAEAYFRAALKTESSYKAAQDNLKQLSHGTKNGDAASSGIGSIKIPNLKVRTVEVYSQESSGGANYEAGFAGAISPEATELQVPSGIYKLKFAEHFLERVEVRGRKSTEVVLGVIRLPTLSGRTVEVYSQESSGGANYEAGFAGAISPEATELQVPVGRYKLKFASHFLENIVVEPGQEITL